MKNLKQMPKKADFLMEQYRRNASQRTLCLRAALNSAYHKPEKLTPLFSKRNGKLPDALAS